MTVYNPRQVEKMGREFNDTMKIYGEIVIRQGRKIVARGRNKFVNQALISLCNLFSDITVSDSGTVYGLNAVELFTIETYVGGARRIGGSLTMRLGTNTTTPTAKDMIALVSAITTAPSSMAQLRDNPSAGVYRAIVTATWNAGTVSGTIGELGLFCCLQKTLGSNVTTEMSITSTLWSRLSSADGDFGSFTIDTGKPLTVEWRIVFQF